MASQTFQIRPIDGRGGRAAFWLVFAAVIKSLSVLMFASVILLLANAQNLPREFAAVWGLLPALSLLIMAGFWLSIVFVALWIYRAADNARRLSPGAELSPGLAIGWYFVPIANLFMPFQTMGEIWRISHDPADWRAVSTPSLLFWWWGLWLGASFAGATASLVSRFATETDGVIIGSIFGIASAACAVGAALLLRRIVIRITTLQSRYRNAEVF